MEVERWILGLHKMLDDVRKDIAEICHHQDIPVVIPDIVPDDMSERTRGYSWLNNGHFVANRALINVLIHHPDSDLVKLTTSGLIWSPGAMLQFMGKADGIQDKLSVLVDTAPGQTARSTEFIESKIRNSNRPRNFYRQHGSDWIIIRRIKTENMVQKEVFIPKKVPPELQTVMDFYLLVIRPVEVDFAYKLWGIEAATNYHEFFFVQSGKRTTGTQYSRNLLKISKQYFDCELKVREYRQMEIAIAKAYLGSEYELYEEDINEEDALAEQSGHGATTRRTHYALDPSMLPNLTFDVLLRFGHISEWWWRLIRFYPGGTPLLPLGRRRMIREEARFNFMGPSNTAHMPSNDGTMVLPQAGGSGIDMGRLIETITGVITTSVSQLKIELQDQIQAAVAAGVAEAMVRQGPPLIHPAPPTLPPVNNTSADGWTASEIEDLYMPEERHAAVDPIVVDPPPMEDDDDVALHLLRKLYPDQPNADFKSPEQRDLVERSLTREHSFFGVLPTGGGKSLVWLIPAVSEEKGITLVVIPNKALLSIVLGDLAPPSTDGRTDGRTVT